MLESGAGIIPIPESLCSFLQHKVPGVPIRSILVESPRYVRLANGQTVEVKQEIVPLGLKFHTAWGPVELRPQVFAAYPGDVLILRRIILRMLGSSPNAELKRVARSKLKRSTSAYRWHESRRVGSLETDLAMARSLESKRVFLHDIGTPEHPYSRSEQQAGQELPLRLIGRGVEIWRGRISGYARDGS